MTHYLFCAGGCGARVLESIVHACALGLGPEEIKILTIDPDAGGGNLGKTNDIINKYSACQRVFGGNLGDEQFFRTKLTLLGNGQGDAAGAWSPVSSDQQFRQVVGYDTLTPEQKQIADLFFTPDELSMEMDVGFLGHPSIGAAALSLLPLLRGSVPWNGIAGQLAADLAAGPVRVMIAGSVFGGTGASTFFPLALWLRKAAGNDVHRLSIGVIALSPYFVFPPAGMNARRRGGPDVRKFPQATQAAAQFYNQMRTLATTDPNNWPFAAMFWLGDDDPISLPRCEGGEGQQNPPHFLELLAAHATMEFFEGAPDGGPCYYAGTSGNHPNVMTWAEIPRLRPDPLKTLRRQSLKFLLCGLMHSRFYWPMLVGGDGVAPMQPEVIPWYHRYFFRENRNLAMPPESEAMNAFSEYNRQHVKWWSTMHYTTPHRLLILNTSAFEPKADAAGRPYVQLDNQKMRNLEHPDNPLRHSEGETEFHKFTFAGYPKGAQKGAPAYLAILARASAKFVYKYYGI